MELVAYWRCCGQRPGAGRHLTAFQGTGVRVAQPSADWQNHGRVDLGRVLVYQKQAGLAGVSSKFLAAPRPDRIGRSV